MQVFGRKFLLVSYIDENISYSWSEADLGVSFICWLLLEFDL